MMYYYHIHKVGNNDAAWKPGNFIEVGIENNFFYNGCITFNSRLPYSDDNVQFEYYPIHNLHKYFTSHNMNDMIFNLESVYDKFISEYGMLVRELGLEEIRTKSFSQIPSRTKCIWLCREDQIDYWMKAIGNSNVKIYKVEVFNEAYRLNEENLPSPADSYSEILAKAEKYWSYISDSDKENDEYLYIGKLKIIEEVLR